MDYNYMDYTDRFAGYGKAASNLKQRKNQGKRAQRETPSPAADLEPERISSRIIIADPAQPEEETEKKEPIFKLDRGNIISGIIFSELLGKPRARRSGRPHLFKRP